MTLLRRWGLWALVVGVALAALAVGSARHAHPTLEERTTALAGQVRCPVCGGESAAQSSVPAALAIRTQIHNELAAGIPAARVLDDVTASYGTSILERPAARGIGLLVWVLPAVAGALGVAGLGVSFARWRRDHPADQAGGDGPPAGAGPAAGADPDDTALVDEALRARPSR